MAQRKDFKALVRERMQQTGESYSIARMRVQQQAEAPPEPAPITSPTGEAFDLTGPMPDVIH